MKKTGLFICHCGINIASTVDIAKVKDALKNYPGIAYIQDYKYLCSDPGQALVKKKITEEGLERVVIAACSPTLHENTFRSAVNSVGMNLYNCEIANIREQCSWVHKDKSKATQKAISIIQSIIEKTKLNESLKAIKLPVTKIALVIGGGISGMQAALNIANSGYEVYLLERSPSIGGHMAQLSETFPTLDCSQCILTPKMVEISQNKNIKLITYSEISEISGFVGNFNVKIKRKAPFIDWNKCTGCGICTEKCPTKIPYDFDRMLGVRKAIYTPFPQAVPNKVVIDKENCLYFKSGKCQICKKICPLGAVDFEQEDWIEEIKVGAVVVATGYDIYEKENIQEYSMGYCEDVVDGLTFERLLSASGPTAGKIVRPSDGKIPKEVIFIQCVGSRDQENHFAYCSRICCMYTAKQAMLYKHRVPNGQAYVFYMDIRAGGKNYEEFVQRAVEEDDILYLRGRVSKLYLEEGKIIVIGVDTLSCKKVEIKADMVVLATAMRPSKGIEDVVKILKIQIDSNGFLSEAHPKLRPVETLTQGIFLAGCAQAPKDIPDTVSQAGAAASKVVELLSQSQLSHEPITSWIDEEICAGCGQCVSQCVYDAIELDKKKNVAHVNDILCEGCGACIVTCPSGAVSQKNFTMEQYYSMIESFV